MDAAVDIRPTYNALNFLSEACPVRALVDGHGPYRLAWNQAHRVPVPAGDHMVVVWSSYLLIKGFGTSHALVHVEPGQVVGLAWTMPLTLFSAPRLVAQPVGPAVAFAAVEPGPVPPHPGTRALWPPHPVQPLTEIPGTPGPPSSPAAPSPVPSGQWAADPTGRHAHRWWDGTRWTDAVSDGTTTTSDPI